MQVGFCANVGADPFSLMLAALYRTCVITSPCLSWAAHSRKCTACALLWCKRLLPFLRAGKSAAGFAGPAHQLKCSCCVQQSRPRRQPCCDPALQAGIYDQFSKAVVQEVNKFKLGDGLVDGTTLGPLISPAAVERVSLLLEQRHTAAVACCFNLSWVDGDTATSGPALIQPSRHISSGQEAESCWSTRCVVLCVSTTKQ